MKYRWYLINPVISSIIDEFVDEKDQDVYDENTKNRIEDGTYIWLKVSEQVYQNWNTIKNFLKKRDYTYKGGSSILSSYTKWDSINSIQIDVELNRMYNWARIYIIRKNKNRDWTDCNLNKFLNELQTKKILYWENY